MVTRAVNAKGETQYRLRDDDGEQVLTVTLHRLVHHSLLVAHLLEFEEESATPTEEPDTSPTRVLVFPK